jgi:hypothetical protein
MSCRRSGNQLPGAPVLLWLCSSVPDWIPIKPSFLGPSPPSQAFLGPSAARSSLRSRRDPGRPDRVFLPGRDPSGPGRPPWARARLHRRVFGPARDRGGPVPSCLGATPTLRSSLRSRARPGVARAGLPAWARPSCAVEPSVPCATAGGPVRPSCLGATPAGGRVFVPARDAGCAVRHSCLGATPAGGRVFVPARDAGGPVRPPWARPRLRGKRSRDPVQRRRTRTPRRMPGASGC